MQRHLARVVLSLLLSSFHLVASAAEGQAPTGSIEGTVTTPNGGGLSGVVVTARNRTDGVERATTTNADGEYVLSALPVTGAYEVTAELAGFAPIVRRDVRFDPNGTARVQFTMRGELAEVVAVTAPAPPFQRDRSTVQQRISEELVHSLPLAGRDFLSLASLTAGFTGNPNFPSPQGQVFWSNNVIVDGASHFSKWRSAAAHVLFRLLAGIDQGSPGTDQPVLCRVRRGARHGDERHHQLGHERAARQPALLRPGRCAERHAGVHERQAALVIAAVRRDARRTDREGSDAFLHELRRLAIARSQHRSVSRCTRS